MVKSNKNPFSPGKKQIVFAAIFSAALHIGFVLYGSSTNFALRPPKHQASKPLPSPCMFEPIPAAKQRALTETLNRFFPFIATPGLKKKNSGFGTPVEESSPKLLSMDEKLSESFGEDAVTCINFEPPGLEIPSISHSNIENSNESNNGKSFPFEAPLNLEPADIVREIDSPKMGEKASFDEGEEGPTLTSSTFLLSEAPIHEPFELESSRADYKNSSLPLEKPEHLFEQAQNEGLAFTKATALESENSTKLHTTLPHINIAAKDLAPVQKKSEFGVILSDHFKVTTESFQLKDRPLFVFRIELKPTKLSYFESLDHELIFLIDRSHSIEKTSFDTFKRSVSHALGLLPKKTLFNLALFDKNISLFEEKSALAQRDHLIRAKTFLIGQDHGGLFASTDLFKTLDVVESRLNPDVLSTLVLLTDGDTFLSSEQQKAEMLKFIKNRGKNFSLYTFATGTSNNLNLLDEIASLGGGCLIYESESSELQKRFAGSIRSLATPLMKEIQLSVKEEENREVTFLTPSHRMPVMYGRSPYTIFGVTNKPGDLTLFVQGQGKKGPITIKKTVSISDAHTVSSTLLEEIEHLDHINRIESNLIKSQSEED